MQIVGQYHPNRKVNEDHTVSAARGNTQILDKNAVAQAVAKAEADSREG